MSSASSSRSPSISSADSRFSSEDDDGFVGSSMDGGHLDWRLFRRDVLTPHQIKLFETTPHHVLPRTLLTLIEAATKDVARFAEQKTAFRAQILQGRGFGPSQLFPPNLLPNIDAQPEIARCMAPTLSGSALPERIGLNKGPLYELSAPHPKLGCGFSSAAFTLDDLAQMPEWLIAPGTLVCYDTGYISSGVALHCPFLLFERTFGQVEERLETANNSCAISGAWSLRGTQMLFSRAWPAESPNRPQPPSSFTCTIDNEIAIINLHWIDHAQVYCMSPLCKFDLTKDNHFDQFLIWIEAIGKWAISDLLPKIKRALNLIKLRDPTMPNRGCKSFKAIHHDVSEEESLVAALKSTFDTITWRTDNDAYTPISSSVASWGSPIVNDMVFTNLDQLKSCSPESANVTPTVANQSASQKRPTSITPILSRQNSVPMLSHPRTPNSPRNLAYDPAASPSIRSTTDTLWQRRLDDAADQIKDLQSQLHLMRQEMSMSASAFRTELSGLKNTMTCVLRKDTMPLRNRLAAVPKALQWNHLQPEIQFARQRADFNVVTTPTEPVPTSIVPQNPRHVRSSLSTEVTAIASDSDCADDVRTDLPEQFIQSTTLKGTISQHPIVRQSRLGWASKAIMTSIFGDFHSSTALRMLLIGCLTQLCLVYTIYPAKAT